MKFRIFLMMTIAIGLSIIHAQTNAQTSSYAGDKIVSKIYGAQLISFAIDNPPAGKVCEHYSRHFIFDASTAAGKNMLSILLAAEMANRKVNIWFIESTAPGTDHTNGCSSNTLAKVTAIGIVDI